MKTGSLEVGMPDVESPACSASNYQLISHPAVSEALEAIPDQQKPMEGPLVRKIKALNSFIDGPLKDLDPTAALIWLVLIRHAHDGFVEISHARLAQTLGVSRRTVIRHIQKLKESRLVRTVYRGGKGRGVNTYQLGRGLPVRPEKPEGHE
jgi:DNA-binding transcriptional ArsR family regulator